MASARIKPNRATTLWSWCIATAVACTLPVAPPAGAGEREKASIAMIDFTARHVDKDEVEQFSHNLREMFLIDSRFDMVDEMAMYEVLTGPAGGEQLGQARKLLAEAKRAYRGGDLETAERDIEEARALYRSLHSELSRPEELSDLFLYEGLVALAAGKPESAKVAFIQMFLLDPDIETRGLPSIPSPAHDLLDEAREQVRKMPLRGIRPAFARDIASRMNVGYLLTGVVERTESGAEARGIITIQLMTPSSEEPETTFIFEIPDIEGGLPVAGDPIYERIVGVAARFLPGA